MKRKEMRAGARQTREKLLQAGRKAFASKGFGGASLREDILAASGISAGSFYHQFRDKADLLAEIVRTDGARVIEAVGGADGEATLDPAARALRLFGHMFDRAEKNPYFVKIFVREYYSDAPVVQRAIRAHTENTMNLLARFYDQLGVARGVTLDSRSLSVIVTCQIFSVLNYYIGQPRRVRNEMRPALIRSTLQLMVGGVLAVKRPADPVPASETEGSASDA
jgi:AcrR family transcriptional regulator